MSEQASERISRQGTSRQVMVRQADKSWCEGEDGEDGEEGDDGEEGEQGVQGAASQRPRRGGDGAEGEAQLGPSPRAGAFRFRVFGLAEEEEEASSVSAAVG